jgi:hypothetical protein
MWAVRVLTADYLIDGWVDPESYTTRLSSFKVNANPDTPLWLAAPRFQQTHSAAALISASDRKVAIYFDSLIAVIPADEPSLASARKENSMLQYPIPAELHAGSYRITGDVLILDKRFSAFDAVRVFFVQNAVVDSLLPDAMLSNVQAPYVFVASRQIQVMLVGP